MHNLNYQQTIAIGVACLFGIPACAGLVVGHFMGAWFGIGTFTALVVIIAFIAQQWWQKQNKGKDEGGNERHDTETH